LSAVPPAKLAVLLFATAGVVFGVGLSGIRPQSPQVRPGGY
jgi:hypothetical protein